MQLCHDAVRSTRRAFEDVVGDKGTLRRRRLYYYYILQTSARRQKGSSRLSGVRDDSKHTCVYIMHLMIVLRVCSVPSQVCTPPYMGGRERKEC